MEKAGRSYTLAAGGHVAVYIGRTHDRFRTAIKSCKLLLELNGPSTHVLWAFVDQRRVELGIVETPERTEALRNKGLNRTPEKRELLRRSQERSHRSRRRAHQGVSLGHKRGAECTLPARIET